MKCLYFIRRNDGYFVTVTDFGPNLGSYVVGIGFSVRVYEAGAWNLTMRYDAYITNAWRPAHNSVPRPHEVEPKNGNNLPLSSPVIMLCWKYITSMNLLWTEARTCHEERCTFCPKQFFLAYSYSNNIVHNTICTRYVEYGVFSFPQAMLTVWSVSRV
jgi:hypothetical protein